MKKSLLTIIILAFATSLYGQSIIIDEDGIVKCEDVPIGTTETISGDTYEVVDGGLLGQRRDEGADLTLVCVSNVTQMSLLFRGYDFNQPIGNWDVSNVTEMGEMFSHSQFNQPIGNWDVSNVTRMTAMFSVSPFNQNLSTWDVSNVMYMSEMFGYSQFNQPIENWDVSNVRSMGWMFIMSPFNQPIGNWDVSNVTRMNSMFYQSSFNQSIGNWDVSNVISMSAMFADSPFNQPIGDWDVSKVKYMQKMFLDTPFNQPINQWCVSQFPSEPDHFSTNSPLTAENKPMWGTCPGSPPEPILLSPENGSTLGDLTPMLTWSPFANSEFYTIQVSNDDFSSFIADEVVTDTTFTTPSLSYSTEYQWRVRATYSSWNSEWSETWSFSTDTETSIDEEELPSRFELKQNYPNPFNPATLIEFSLPTAAHVRLEVFTVSGQLIHTLVNGTMNLGNHTVRFDGKSLSSGVYIYRLSTSEFTDSRMMNLIK